MNISKAKIKLIHSLDSKKGRRESGLFIAEGPKVVGDLLELMTARLIIATADGWKPTTTVSMIQKQ